MAWQNSEKLFDRLEVLDDTQPQSGAFNMALDEVLLHGLAETSLLRIYRWARPAISFGYFEAWEPLAEGYPARELVRRWTGGGVVEHGQDVTYSLLLPRIHPLTNLPAGESYRLIHGALLAAIIEMGWTNASLCEISSPPKASGTRACFVNPVRYDLISDGHKISGAAQRRTRQGLLHQGSVQNPEGTPLDPGFFPKVLAEALALQPRQRFLTLDEQATAADLSFRKYASAGWMRRV